ncbi:MAG: hypothetical protein ACNA71_00460 [Kiritimatiellia bacterium]
MGTGRTFNKKPISRPKKGVSERTRRIATHRKRLVALGLPEEQLRTMNPDEMRTLLQRPKLLVAK